ncbi:MAG: hypothetical protein KGK06_09365, partial [Xanthomonadaceae bacterium]|nr:hypothetical protein [Xanthomonadaceae bacterium]
MDGRLPTCMPMDAHAGGTGKLSRQPSQGARRDRRAASSAFVLDEQHAPRHAAGEVVADGAGMGGD